MVRHKEDSIKAAKEKATAEENKDKRIADLEKELEELTDSIERGLAE